MYSAVDSAGGRLEIQCAGKPKVAFVCVHNIVFYSLQSEKVEVFIQEIETMATEKRIVLIVRL